MPPAHLYEPCVRFVIASPARLYRFQRPSRSLAKAIRSPPLTGLLVPIGELGSTLEAAAGRPVHLVLLDEAPPGLSYRVFRRVAGRFTK